MPTAPRTALTVVACAMLLAACGTQSASPGGDDRGRVRAEKLCPSDFSQYGGAPSAEPTAGPSGTPSPVPVPSGDDGVDDGVKITALYAWGPESGCAGADYTAEFEVTNQQTQAATYTVTLAFRSASAGPAVNRERVVESVAPGRTVKSTVVMKETTVQTSQVSGVEVVEVRSVPTAEASSASGPCPESGVHLYADKGDAAMGLRAVGLHLINCGTGTYRLNGYPKLELQDEDHDTVAGVRILQGTDRISTGVAGSAGPRPVVLRPGEAARTTLAWRNTTQAGDPVNAPYVRVWAKPDADPVMVVPELDLGTTGKLGVGPWQKDETYQAPATGAPQQ
ncbi:DUF4232 domain-containing protein [Streptomyces ferrugineus]|uniref:DUF4232 domain-containing protein n=1 Tax=Streptomyces ferrugineus TaxID=1413221 RepID=A0A7M2SNQ4_9ACTN|nr:DUF4232 domain-containing protein [Streptomyces ferrugineus]QOV37986.1 DUF4232 domain-containing protein [Streptomyces ferrugineus]